MKVDIINKSGYPDPEYKTPGSAGCDLRAVLPYPRKLGMLDRITIPTGIYISLPEGYEAKVQPRSGLAKKHGILAMVGQIDADYRGEIGVTIINLSKEEYTIQPGDSIAQLVIAKVEQAEWNDVDELDPTERGEKGFGSSGR